MIVKELKDVVNKLSSREDERSLAICGNVIRLDHDPTRDFDISWIDCSDSILLCINYKDFDKSYE